MKNIWKQALAALLSLVPAAVFAQAAPADTLTLEQVVREVVRNNDRVKAAAFMEESERRRIGQIGRAHV